MTTLPLFFAAAAEAAGAPGPIESLQQTFEHFGVEPKLIAMQVFSFLVVLFVLYKFAIKPVTATMEERTQKISAGLKHAEEMQAKLAAAQQESAALVKKASQEAGRIVDEARKTSKEYVEKQTQEAAAKANDILQKAQQAIELEHKKMLADARGEIARLVVTTTQRVLAKELSEADRARYNEAAGRELTGV
jgi:F-type H+-transporting ATPase subunit b